MKIVGLTGGIGSGKSTVAKFFLGQGIPVYNSDSEARRMMNENREIKQKLGLLFGGKAYFENKLNRPYIASQVFKNKELLSQLNRIVHPAVFEDFRQWTSKQDSVFVVKEAAILFESGSYKDCDFVVSVIADEDLRIRRVSKRDNISAEKVRDRIKNQWTDEMRVAKSDFVIHNNSDLENLYEEFKKVYNELLKRTWPS